MRAGALPLAGFGGLLVAVSQLGVFVFDLAALPAALLGGAGAAAIVTGCASEWIARRGRLPAQDEALGVEVLPRSSLATVALVCGLTLMLVGSVTGQAIFWPGVGITAFGLGGLIREHRAARRLLAGQAAREATARGGAPR